MPQTPFSTAIRGVLTQYGMTAGDIDADIAGELKEAVIAHSRAAAVQNINLNKVQFGTDMDQAITGLGAVWTHPVYNLTPLNLPFGVKLVATEELSAIKTHSPSPNFDAAKALTNMLRMIKIAEK